MKTNFARYASIKNLVRFEQYVTSLTVDALRECISSIRKKLSTENVSKKSKHIKSS